MFACGLMYTAPLDPLLHVIPHDDINIHVNLIKIEYHNIEYIGAHEFSRYKHLTGLTLRMLKFGDNIDPFAFSGTKLEHLRLVQNKLTLVPMAVLAVSSTIQLLNLQFNPIYNVSVLVPL